jgi:hypothetical protein
MLAWGWFAKSGATLEKTALKKTAEQVEKICAADGLVRLILLHRSVQNGVPTVGQ